MTKPIVIVGAGQAAASFISRYIMHADRLPVLLIGEEPTPPYQRPPLSKKYLSGEFQRGRLWIRQSHWYHEHGIETRFGTRITQLMPEKNYIITDSGESIEYEKLILCTGSKARCLPKTLGGSLEGVLTLRSLNDADNLSTYLNSRHRLVIIGGGYIGLEIAATARTLGHAVTVIEIAKRILQRVASEETSEYFRALHKDHGVNILESTGLTRIFGKGEVVQGVELNQGERIEADAVLVGIGATPNTELANSAGIDCDNGIAINETCQTSIPNIYAAGDCTSFIRNGQRIRLESVQNAADQGDLIARILSGKNDQYTSTPWFWSEQYDCMLQIAGLSQGYTQTTIRKNSRTGGQSVWYYQNNQLIAVDAMNDTKSYAFGRRMIEMGIHPSLDQISDEATDLKVLLQTGQKSRK
ncbi:MAG: FAD-dependent oxidoreductase [Gammaproteobacteria bacterium]|nr:FAD-dependent oxidoreductase [Gammaproteobacteria bacterium]MCY4218117.1 FAD-dependent oxidoreductase [Gammaproteobacteria bacterium]MCY4273927.1 FAD-dependent oxidoreductase [Gammaproteobacteria bacterium]